MVVYRLTTGSAGPISVLPSSNVPVSVPSSPTAPLVVPVAPTIPASVPLASTPSVYIPLASTPSVYIPPASAIPVSSSSTTSHWAPPVPTVNCTLQACNSRLWNETGPDILDVRQGTSPLQSCAQAILIISPPERLLVESSSSFRHSPREEPNHELLFPSSH